MMLGGGGGGGGVRKPYLHRAAEGEMIWLERCTMASCCRRWHCWSQLPPELLGLVLQRLPHPDCLSFGKVCTSWRSAFLDRRRLTRPPPCIMNIPNTGTIPLDLFCLDRDQLRILPSLKPQLTPRPRIVGYGMGWLVVASLIWSPSSIHLLNPITNERIPLPSVATGGVPMYPSLNSYLYPPGNASLIIRVNLSSPPTTGDCHLVARVWDQPDKVFRLARCKLGDCQWTIITFEPRELLENAKDSLFHKGKLFVLGFDRDLLICKFDPQPKITTVRRISNKYSNRLVLSDGEVLLVVIQVFSCNIPSKLHVFRYTEEHGGRWVRVESLGDRTIFIGKLGAESLCSKDLMGSTYEANCIYYQNFFEFLEKYCMSDKSNRQILIPRSPNTPAPHLQWIAPTAW